MPGADQARWVDRLQEDDANLRAALDWSIEQGSIELAQRLSTALWRYWQIAGLLRAGRGYVDRVVALGADERSPARMWSLAAAAGIAYWQGDTVRAHSLYLEQLALARAIGGEAGEADAYMNLSATESIAGDAAQGHRWVAAARAAYERLGDDVGVARTLWSEHNLLVFERRMDEASAVLHEAVLRYEANGDVLYQAGGAAVLTWKLLLDGDPQAARPTVIRALTMFHAMRDFATTTITLAAAATVLLELGAAGDAAILFGTYSALAEASGVRPPAGVGYIIERMQPVRRVVEALDHDRYRAATARGRRLSLDQAVAFALERLERVAREDGATTRAPEKSWSNRSSPHADRGPGSTGAVDQEQP
jgi:non-specific serine/threonine protein kinase